MEAAVDNPRAVIGHNQPPPTEAPALQARTKFARTIRVVAGLIETAFEIPPGTILSPGRGGAEKQLAVHILVYVLVREFDMPIVATAKAIARDRGHMRKNAELLAERSGKSDAVARALAEFSTAAKIVVAASNGIADRRVHYTERAAA